ncbi:MAG: sigma-54 dependent transcriptional regulator [Zavarzinella sp.]
MSKHLIIVDDEEAITWSLKKAFERKGFQVSVAPSAELGLDIARKEPPDCVVLDVRLPGMDGLEALHHFKKISPHSPIIVITAHGTLSTAVKAVEGGAFDYLAKPFDLQQMEDTVARALSSSTRQTFQRGNDSDIHEEMVGNSPAMQAVFKRIALVAPSDASVLITGESGTGKELVARAIHRLSQRSSRPLFPVHVAALNPNLAESELFGHTKGAFTGAHASKQGLLAIADGGTVFLDELADIPLNIQAKLLRVLEHQELTPVGGSAAQKIQVRILAATNANLIDRVREGEFRDDLYYRLNVFEVHLPALRDRQEDIPILVDFHLQKLQANRDVPVATIDYLKSRHWPGNVRELRNAVEHAVIMARGRALLPEHFPPPIQSVMQENSDQETLLDLFRTWVRHHLDPNLEDQQLHQEMLDYFEPVLIEEVLNSTNMHRGIASRKLGMARTTFRKLLRKYRPTEPDDLE